MDSVFTTNIQEQIEKLYKQLQKKDHIINELKFLIARQCDEDPTLSDESRRVTLKSTGSENIDLEDEVGDDDFDNRFNF